MQERTIIPIVVENVSPALSHLCWVIFPRKATLLVRVVAVCDGCCWKRLSLVKKLDVGGMREEKGSSVDVDVA